MPTRCWPRKADRVAEWNKISPRERHCRQEPGAMAPRFIRTKRQRIVEPHPSTSFTARRAAEVVLARRDEDAER